MPRDTSTLGAEPAPVLAVSTEERGRRVLFLLVAALFAAAAGIALNFVKIPLVFAGIAAIFSLFIVLKNPYVGLLVYVIVFSLRLGEVFPVLAPLRLERIIGLITFGVLALSMIRRHGRITFDGSRVTRHFYLIILAAFLSVPFAYWRAGAWGGVIDFIKLLIYFLMIVHLVDTRAKMQGLIVLHLGLMAFLASDSIFNYLKGSLLHAQGIDRAIGSTSMAAGPNELAATMATTIPIVFFLAVSRGGKGRLRIWLWILVAVMVYALVITGSRSGLIGFVASMAYVWWRSRYRIMMAILGVGLLAGLFLTLPEQYQGRYATMASGALDGSSSERLKVWGKGVRMVLNRPLTGVGVHCFGTANAYSFSSGPRASWLESHSLYVQVPAEMGLIGAFAWFSFLFQIFRMNLRARSHLEAEGEEWAFEHAVMRGMFGGLIALMFTGVFGHSMMRDTWYLYAAIGVAMVRIYLAERPEVAARASKWLTGRE